MLSWSLCWTVALARSARSSHGKSRKRKILSDASRVLSGDTPQEEGSAEGHGLLSGRVRESPNEKKEWRRKFTLEDSEGSNE